MTLSAALLLTVALQAPAAEQPPAGRVESDSVPPPADSYADTAAASLMARTRAYGDSTKSGIEAYRMLSRYALSVGLSTGRRDRLLYKREMAWRVSWRRDVEWRVEILGSRESLPLVRSGSSVGDLNDEIGTVDPEFIIGNRGQWVLRLPSSDGSSNGLEHPLAPGSEAHYRFATGDTTRIDFPGSGRVTLIELKVAPRRPSARLLSGSYWLDAASGAPVRAAFRLAAPAQVNLDFTARQLLPGLADASFDLDYLTLEYALSEGRWWLPRLLSLQGRGRYGGVDIPLLVEQTFEDVQVFGQEDEWQPLPPPDTILLRQALAGSSQQRYSTDSAGSSASDSTHPPGSPADTLVRQTYVPRSDTALLNSPLLSSSASEISSSLSDLDIERIRGALEAALPAPAALRPEVAWTIIDPGLLRYNRVEGFSIGSTLEARYGRYSLDAAVRIGVAGPTPSGAAAFRRSDASVERSLRGYSEVQPFTPGDRPLALGNSVSALLFGRDEGDYYRATGVSAAVAGRFTRWSRGEMTLNLFAERQTPLEVNTHWSVQGPTTLRSNPAADRASQLGAEATFETRTGVNAEEFRGGLSAILRGETGSFDFVRGSLGTYAGFPLPGPLVGSIEAGAGQILGEAPLQSLWYLGGSSTVRGFDPEERVSGNTFWRARGEVGTENPGARGLLFVDAGRAAPQFTSRGPQLISAGVGISVMDGILRADVARALRGGAGWGVQLYLDAPL